jgi:hypothetical protein
MKPPTGFALADIILLSHNFIRPSSAPEAKRLMSLVALIAFTSNPSDKLVGL